MQSHARTRAQVVASGEWQYTNKAEECAGLCAKARQCNVWTWCADSRGCNGGELFRFRQCWLKSSDDPRKVTAKAPGYGASPGWVSGVRLAYVPS